MITRDPMVLNQRCTICGAVARGPVPPPHCPECGARDAMFEPTCEAPHGIEHNPFQPVSPWGERELGPSAGGSCVHR